MIDDQLSRYAYSNENYLIIISKTTIINTKHHNK